MSSKNKAEEAASEDLAALGAEIARLRAELGGLVETAGRIGRERADAIAGSVRNSESFAAGEAALADLEAKLHQIEGEIRASTRRSPWQALGIAAAIGFVFGLILRR